MHSYPVAGGENFPRQNLIETSAACAELVLREKKMNDSDFICWSEANYCKRKVLV